MEQDVVAVPANRTATDPTAGGSEPPALDWLEMWLCREPSELARAVSRLPESEVLADPALLFVAASLGVVRGATAWDVTDRWSTRIDSVSGADEDPERARARAWALLTRSSLQRHAGLHLLALRLAEEAREGSRADTGEDMAVLVHHECGVSALLAGDVELARSAFAAALDEAGGAGAAVRHRLRSMLALCAALAGELLVAEGLLHAVGERSPGRPRTRTTADAESLARVVLHLDRWELARAEPFLRARPPATFGWLWPVALWAHVQHALLTGRHAAALRLVHQAQAQVSAPAWEAGLGAEVVSESQAVLHCSAGDLARAWDSIEHGRPRGVPSQVAQVAVLYAAGEHDAARLLARSLLLGLPTLTRRQRLQVLGLEAGIALAQGDARWAGGAVTHLVRAAGAQRWRSFLAHVPPAVLDGLDEVDLTPLQRRALREDPSIPWLPGPVLSAPLSPSERQVLRHLVDGVSRDEVATSLGVSVNTVKTHVRHLYAKLGVGNRAELVRLVSRLPRASTHLTPPPLEPDAG